MADRRLLAYTNSLLGSALVALRQYAQAESLLVESYQVLRAQPTARDRYTREALEHLIALYTAWGKPEQVNRYELEAGEATQE